MFRVLTRRGLRMRAVIALITAYALCVVAPHVALALTGGAMAVHCLNIADDMPTSQDQAAMGHEHGQAHDHDGAMHSHHDQGPPAQHHDQGGKAPGNCCGVFCMVALPSALGIDVGHERIGSPEFLTPVIKLAGDEPDLPYRPPNV